MQQNNGMKTEHRIFLIFLFVCVCFSFFPSRMSAADVGTTATFERGRSSSRDDAARRFLGDVRPDQISRLALKLQQSRLHVTATAGVTGIHLDTLCSWFKQKMGGDRNTNG